MGKYIRLLAAVFLTVIAHGTFAQDTGSAAELIKQGIQLNNEKKYTEATEKYKAALAIKPDNTQANYQMAFTLFSNSKSAEALPFIDKATKGNNPKFNAAAYSLMGSIYQSLNQLPKAVAAYESAIKADGSNQRIYYNLGIAYFKGKQYGDAEATFEYALKRDSADAGSWRMYALSAFHQNKRPAALLGFCRFLMLEPNSGRTAEAFGNLQNILNGGKLAPEPGQPKVEPKYIAYYNRFITNALAGFTTRRYASKADLLSAQLRAVFINLSVQTASRDKYYFWYGLVDYFATFVPTENMPAFARYVSQSTDPASVKWLKDNPEKVKALEVWIKATGTKGYIK